MKNEKWTSSILLPFLMGAFALLSSCGQEKPRPPTAAVAQAEAEFGVPSSSDPNLISSDEIPPGNYVLTSMRGAFVHLDTNAVIHLGFDYDSKSEKISPSDCTTDSQADLLFANPDFKGLHIHLNLAGLYTSPLTGASFQNPISSHIEINKGPKSGVCAEQVHLGQVSDRFVSTFLAFKQRMKGDPRFFEYNSPKEKWNLKTSFQRIDAKHFGIRYAFESSHAFKEMGLLIYEWTSDTFIPPKRSKPVAAYSLLALSEAYRRDFQNLKPSKISELNGGEYHLQSIEFKYLGYGDPPKDTDTTEADVKVKLSGNTLLVTGLPSKRSSFDIEARLSNVGVSTILPQEMNVLASEPPQANERVQFNPRAYMGIQIVQPMQSPNQAPQTPKLASEGYSFIPLFEQIAWSTGDVAQEMADNGQPVVSKFPDKVQPKKYFQDQNLPYTYDPIDQGLIQFVQEDDKNLKIYFLFTDAKEIAARTLILSYLRTGGPTTQPTTQPSGGLELNPHNIELPSPTTNPSSQPSTPSSSQPTTHPTSQSTTQSAAPAPANHPVIASATIPRSATRPVPGPTTRPSIEPTITTTQPATTQPGIFIPPVPMPGNPATHPTSQPTTAPVTTRPVGK